MFAILMVRLCLICKCFAFVGYVMLLGVSVWHVLLFARVCGLIGWWVGVLAVFVCLTCSLVLASCICCLCLAFLLLEGVLGCSFGGLLFVVCFLFDCVGLVIGWLLWMLFSCIHIYCSVWF